MKIYFIPFQLLNKLKMLLLCFINYITCTLHFIFTIQVYLLKIMFISINLILGPRSHGTGQIFDRLKPLTGHFNHSYGTV